MLSIGWRWGRRSCCPATVIPVPFTTSSTASASGPSPGITRKKARNSGGYGSPRPGPTPSRIPAAAVAAAESLTVEDRRERLVRRVSAEMTRIGHPLSPPVEASLRSVPRHLFLPEGLWPAAYDNAAQLIGWGQTISQPLIVALMTELLRPRRGDAVLEIGSGSGYQAAILSGLVERVYGVETIPALAAKAAERLARLGYGNVRIRQGDGRDGWPEHAPFDGIIVAAAAVELPPGLAPQLRTGGRLVIPLGGHRLSQDLFVFEKRADGTLDGTSVLPVAFVPLV
ncbi:MAG: protein-L-isoaspartate(D-aspartate) O-methyltransferase [Alphaproteobacteria bacterium]|nr:protein-L-isoaspartate(D-aspartate) O-methyltransferase [Alphaproteobacteria bacterium]